MTHEMTHELHDTRDDTPVEPRDNIFLHARVRVVDVGRIASVLARVLPRVFVIISLLACACPRLHYRLLTLRPGAY